jgi:hypothetical protein
MDPLEVDIRLKLNRFLKSLPENEDYRDLATCHWAMGYINASHDISEIRILEKIALEPQKDTECTGQALLKEASHRASSASSSNAPTVSIFTPDSD